MLWSVLYLPGVNPIISNLPHAMIKVSSGMVNVLMLLAIRPQGGELGVIVDVRVTNSLQQTNFVLPTPPSFSDLASTIRLVGESAISRGENIKRQEYSACHLERLKIL